MTFEGLEYKTCKKCGEKYPFTQRCSCEYKRMDEAFIKPSESTIEKPFNFFDTFLPDNPDNPDKRDRLNRPNPYCFLYQFYLTSRPDNIINETDEAIYKIINFPGGGIILSPKYFSYADYMKRIFKVQMEKSISFCEEILYFSEKSKKEKVKLVENWIFQLEEFIGIEQRGIYYFDNKRIGLLGEAPEVRDAFIDCIEQLIKQLKKRVFFKKEAAAENHKRIRMDDVISDDNGAKERFNKEIEYLTKAGFFEKTEDSTRYISKNLKLIVAMIEKWKQEKLFKEAYLMYKTQPDLCHAFCNTFKLNNYESVYKYFKTNYLKDDSSEKEIILKQEVKDSTFAS